MSPTEPTLKNKLERVMYFFPFQLLWVQLKKNHIILFFWFILFGYVTGFFSSKYGIPYLFLFPEYLDRVDFMSHIILGFSCGGFIMAFNISGYIINGFRFPFLATLSRPFLKFTYNNFIIPLTFIIIYIYKIYQFQISVELEPLSQVLTNISGFIVGNFLFVVLSLLYFATTNKSIFKLFGFVENTSYKGNEDSEHLVRDVLHKKRKQQPFNYDREWRVETYISNLFKISLARGSEHYDKRMLQSVFAQNHINASLFEITVIIVFLTIGFFGEYAMFIIPTGASIFLLFTMLLMLSSAIHSWFKGWSITLLILLIVLINFLSKIDAFSYNNFAYGLNYNTTPAHYAPSEPPSKNYLDQINQDKQSEIQSLNNWKNRLEVNSFHKPKLLIINTSGGGLRSALWTVTAMNHLDSALNGTLFNHTHLITGSSGGMIGASFARENYLRKVKKDSNALSKSEIIEGISRDLLNPVTFTLVLNDLGFHFRKFKSPPYEYTIDRGYSFEKQLLKNTSGLLDKKLYDYTKDEASGLIPTMVFAPTIINDGRKLIIASQPISYLTENKPLGQLSNDALIENIDFHSLFKSQDVRNINFTSVLRMNATFPYIMPMVTLPSEPKMKIMDAGIRDNFGMENSLKYLFTFKNWIKENTSGVVILQLRDTHKENKKETIYPKTVLQSFFSPLGSFYNNWTNVQTFQQDQMLQYASLWFDVPLNVLSLQLKNEEAAPISLSWHLTKKEKEIITKAIYTKENQRTINVLKTLLSQEEVSQLVVQ